MTCYQVQIWLPSTREWAYVKSLQYVGAQLMIRVDDKERLSQQTAELRCAELQASHPQLTFRVVQVNEAL